MRVCAGARACVPYFAFPTHFLIECWYFAAHSGAKGEGGVELSHADELWLRVRTPLAERNYFANAICTLSDGVEQWAASLAQHSQTSRVVLAVAPASTLQRALAVAFGGNGAGRPNPTIRRAKRERRREGGTGTDAPSQPASATLATLWAEMLPGSVLLDKNGAVVAGSEQAQQSEEPGQPAVLRQFACMEEAVAVVYENVVCYPVTSSQSVDGAAIAAVCAATASGTGPIGLL